MHPQSDHFLSYHENHDKIITDKEIPGHWKTKRNRTHLQRN